MGCSARNWQHTSWRGLGMLAVACGTGIAAFSACARTLGPFDPSSAGELGFVAAGIFDGGALTYFTGDDGVHGQELWISDGLSFHTRLLKDINPGEPGSFPAYLTALDDKILFAADDGTHGNELWVTDGTEAGTQLVKDIYAGGTKVGPNSGNPRDFVAFDGRLFFCANDGLRGYELWATDGTEVGTVFIKDLAPGATEGVPNNGHPLDFVAFKGKLFFRGFNGTMENELWVSDGTPAGTSEFAEINPTEIGSNPDWLTVFDNRLYFSAASGDEGAQLWVTDGTLENTWRVKAITEEGDFAHPQHLTPAGNLLFMTARGVHEGEQRGAELWVHNGDIGTGNDDGHLELVKDVHCDDAAYESSHPAALTPYKGKLYFSAMNSDNDGELWVSDGTEEGTYVLYTFKPDEGEGGTPYLFTPYADKLFFSAETNEEGFELWVTDGTVAGTQLVQDLVSGAAPSGPTQLTVVGPRLFFAAANAAGRNELWVLDENNEELPDARNVQVCPDRMPACVPLSLRYEFDDDGDPEGGTGILWYRGNVYQPAYDGMRRLPGDALEDGDQWFAVVVPVDSQQGEGAAVASNKVTVGLDLPFGCHGNAVKSGGQQASVAGTFGLLALGLLLGARRRVR